MKKFILFVLVATTAMMISCNNSEKALKERALTLCRYIPDYGLNPDAQYFMTEDFYSILNDAYSLPSFSPMDYEMLFFFTTEKWRPTPDFEVIEVKKTDESHAIAYINVKQKIWNDEEKQDYYIEYEGDRHQLFMEKVDGKWMMSDFDLKKDEFREYVEQCRKEQSLVSAIESYLTDSVAPHYASAEISIPVAILISNNLDDSTDMSIWGDYWVFNYNLQGDTLMTISGGNHPGCFHIAQQGENFAVTKFDEAESGSGCTQSMQRIFDTDYETYLMMTEEEGYLENHRKEAIAKYAKRHGITVNFYQDYGWDAVKIPAE